MDFLRNLNEARRLDNDPEYLKWLRDADKQSRVFTYNLEDDESLEEIIERISSFVNRKPYLVSEDDESESKLTYIAWRHPQIKKHVIFVVYDDSYRDLEMEVESERAVKYILSGDIDNLTEAAYQGNIKDMERLLNAVAEVFPFIGYESVGVEDKKGELNAAFRELTGMDWYEWQEKHS